MRSQQRDEMSYQRHVGRRHLIIAQAVWSDPGEFLSFPWGHDALPAPAYIERHEKMEVRISVARRGGRADACLGDGNSQFLSELTDERLFRPLAWLHLAARELPQSGHRAAGRTLCEQNAAIGIDQRACCDEDEFHAARPSGKRRSVGWVER